MAKIKKKIWKYQSFLRFNNIALAALVFYGAFLHIRLYNLGKTQNNIATVLLGSINDQDSEKVKTHSIEILHKISNYESCGSDVVDEMVLQLYNKAYSIAKTGNKTYFYFENMGDGMLLAYRQGSIDGNKMWNKNKTQL